MATKLFPISNILEFQTKSRRKAGDGLASGKYPFFTSSQVQSKWLDEADYKIEALVLGTGGSPSVHCANNFSTSADVFILVPKTTTVSIKYVSYFLRGHMEILERGFKGAGLKHLSRDYVSKISIPLPLDAKGNPDIKEQNRIVTLFEEAEDLKKKRAEADKKMTGVIPALFSQMFGEKDYPKDKIINITVGKGAIRTGPFGSQLHHAEFTSEGIPVLGIDNVVSNVFRWAQPRHLPIEKYNKFKKFRVYPGDVLITIMGTVGRVCVAPDDLPECMSTKHLCVVTPDTTRVNPVYLWASLLHDSNLRHQTRNVAKGAIMEGWNSTIIKNLLISLPPIKLQNEFAKKVKEILAIEIKQKKSGEQISYMFNSLLAKI